MCSTLNASNHTKAWAVARRFSCTRQNSPLPPNHRGVLASCLSRTCQNLEALKRYFPHLCGVFFMKYLWVRGAGGVLPKQIKWGCTCGPLLKPFSLFMTKIRAFPHPIYDHNLRICLTYLWPDQKFDTLFMTWPLNGSKMTKSIPYLWPKRL